MATPTTLVALAGQHITDRGTDKTAAQAAAAQAQTDLTNAEQAVAAAHAEYAKQQAAAADIRSKLALITTPADGAPLLAQLEQTIIASRAAAAAGLTAEATRAKARAALSEAQSRVQQAGAGLTQALAALDQANADDKRRQAGKVALTRPPLSTLPARATTLLGSATFTNARNRVEGDFPQALRDRARERAALAAAHLTRATQAYTNSAQLLNAQLTAKGGPDDRLQPLRDAVSAAEAGLLGYVGGAKERCDRAEAALKRIGSTTNPPLTQAEKDRINDATLKTDREAAAAKESDRDKARDVVDQKQAAFDLERLKVLVAQGEAGLTQALADANSDVAKAKTALDDAVADLQGKEAAYTAPMRALMDGWEAALPDSAWTDLSDFDAADATLQALQASPVALVTALNAGESALLAALLLADQDGAALVTASTAAAQQHARLDFEAGAAQRLAFAALRGDN
jgi:hypothetical protein